MLTLAPFDEQRRKYSEAAQIDAAMYSRLQGKKLFKIGQTERIVYEKVAGLKRINSLQSIMYNFSSEGAYADSKAIFQLVGPAAEEI